MLYFKCHVIVMNVGNIVSYDVLEMPLVLGYERPKKNYHISILALCEIVGK